MNEQISLNKKEMAKRIGVSLPTLTSWIERWDDFPIVERGTNGARYRFNPHDVLLFISEKQAEERAKTAERDERLTSIQLEMAELFPEEESVPEESHSDIKKQLDAWKLRAFKRKEAEISGRLLIASEVRDNLMDVFARLGSETRSFWKRSCIRNGIPAPVVDRLLDDYADVQRTLVNSLSDSLRSEIEDSHEERTLDL